MPTIDGVTVRAPNTYTRRPVHEGSRRDQLLASGRRVRYQGGHRTAYAMTWRNVDEATAVLLELIGESGRTFPYLDDDTGRTVRVQSESVEVEAVAGTSPTRYVVSLELVTADPVVGSRR